MMKSYFDYSDEVKKALVANEPVLALESTIISHGLPYPENLTMGLEVEDIARAEGVTPATIAVINGRIKIGLTQDELEQFATDKSVVKTSCRDLASVITQKQSAGTTVAATLFCAAHAGIKVFSTGGIGGVHRGDAQDISADLIELSRHPVAVICAGAKAILDLPRTLELLETLSVPLVGFNTTVLPAFYTRTTSYELPASVKNINDLAATIQTHWQLGFNSGVLVANPIPMDAEIPTSVIEPVIINAIKKADELKIGGKALTPFLLSEIAQVTQGKSLQANLALIKNNVRVGAQLARQLGQHASSWYSKRHQTLI